MTLIQAIDVADHVANDSGEADAGFRRASPAKLAPAVAPAGTRPLRMALFAAIPIAGLAYVGLWICIIAAIAAGVRGLLEALAVR